MPNMCIHVHGCVVRGDKQLHISYDAGATDGNTVSDSVVLDFASSATAINSAIIAAAKAKHSEQIGTVFANNDKIILVGGVV